MASSVSRGAAFGPVRAQRPCPNMVRSERPAAGQPGGAGTGPGGRSRLGPSTCISQSLVGNRCQGKPRTPKRPSWSTWQCFLSPSLRAGRGAGDRKGASFCGAGGGDGAGGAGLTLKLTWFKWRSWGFGGGKSQILRTSRAEARTRRSPATGSSQQVPDSQPRDLHTLPKGGAPGQRPLPISKPASTSLGPAKTRSRTSRLPTCEGVLEGLKISHRSRPTCRAPSSARRCAGVSGHPGHSEQLERLQVTGQSATAPWRATDSGCLPSLQGPSLCRPRGS